MSPASNSIQIKNQGVRVYWHVSFRGKIICPTFCLILLGNEVRDVSHVLIEGERAQRSSSERTVTPDRDSVDPQFGGFFCLRVNAASR